MSVFYGLDTEAYDREYSDRELLQRIFRYFAPHRRRVAVVGLLIAGIALLGTAQPLAVSRGKGCSAVGHGECLGYRDRPRERGFAARHRGANHLATPKPKRRSPPR